VLVFVTLRFDTAYHYRVASSHQQRFGIGLQIQGEQSRFKGLSKQLIDAVLRLSNACHFKAILRLLN
jgi:hypothetical protein